MTRPLGPAPDGRFLTAGSGPPVPGWTAPESGYFPRAGR